MTLGDYPGEQRALELQGWEFSGQAHLSWQAVTGAVAYRIVRDWDETDAATTAGTIYQETWVGPEHVYMVYALDGSGDILAAEGVLVSTARVTLHGMPADQAIHLTWELNTTPAFTGTWQIDYYTTTATVPLTVTLSQSDAQAYTLTDLTNYQWYTVTLYAMLDETIWLSDTVRVMPTGNLLYLPVVQR
jgi:hypothetical protein